MLSGQRQQRQEEVEGEEQQDDQGEELLDQDTSDEPNLEDSDTAPTGPQHRQLNTPSHQNPFLSNLALVNNSLSPPASQESSHEHHSMIGGRGGRGGARTGEMTSWPPPATGLDFDAIEALTTPTGALNPAGGSGGGIQGSLEPPFTNTASTALEKAEDLGAPGASWKNRLAQEDYIKTMERILDGEFSLRELFHPLISYLLFFGFWYFHRPYYRICTKTSAMSLARTLVSFFLSSPYLW